MSIQWPLWEDVCENSWNHGTFIHTYIKLSPEEWKTSQLALMSDRRLQLRTLEGRWQCWLYWICHWAACKQKRFREATFGNHGANMTEIQGCTRSVNMNVLWKTKKKKKKKSCTLSIPKRQTSKASATQYIFTYEHHWYFSACHLYHTCSLVNAIHSKAAAKEAYQTTLCFCTPFMFVS